MLLQRWASSMITKTMATECTQIAGKYADQAAMRSSALLCWSDAVTLIEKGDYEHAFQRALKSVAYSVGIASPEYAKHLIVLNDHGTLDVSFGITLNEAVELFGSADECNRATLVKPIKE